MIDVTFNCSLDAFDVFTFAVTAAADAIYLLIANKPDGLTKVVIKKKLWGFR